MGKGLALCMPGVVLPPRQSTSPASGLKGLLGFPAAKEGMEDDTDLLIVYNAF